MMLGNNRSAGGLLDVAAAASFPLIKERVERGTATLGDPELDLAISTATEAHKRGVPGANSVLAALKAEKARRAGGSNITTYLFIGGGLVAAYLLFIRK